MPSTMTGPGPSIDAPLAATPFTVSNSRLVSASHKIAPLNVEYARNVPSFDPENTTPGMTLIAAACAALQRGPAVHLGGCGGAYQARSPLCRLTACNPPGAAPKISETAKYACSPSTADPHSMPPSAPPAPARYCQMTSPRFSGSSAHPMPDFCPTTITRLPCGSIARIGELPRS